ncbi:FAD-dependent oxidoreductase [Gordonia sinesedis]
MNTPTETPVVIAGTGIAGITAAETLRGNGFTGPITVFGGEPDLPYRRTALSKDLVGADVSIDKIALRKPEFWADKGIEVRAGVGITDVDAAKRTVTGSDGSTTQYRALILATGGAPILPGWMDQVPSLRTRGDAEAIKALIGSTQEFSVIGGGLIGLELAASGAAAGYQVSVYERDDQLMGRVVPDVVSDFLLELHRAHGVTVHLGAQVAEAAANQLVLADGTRRETTVIAAMGMCPETGLAAAAGADTTPVGVLVDDCLRTTVPGVYAAGDVAALPHPITGDAGRAEHWMAATEQGRTVAATVIADLADEPADPHRDVPLAWTIQYGTNIQIVGWPTLGDRMEIDGSVADADATIRIFDEHGLIGGIAIGRPKDGRTIRSEIDLTSRPTATQEVAV